MNRIFTVVLVLFISVMSVCRGVIKSKNNTTNNQINVSITSVRAGGNVTAGSISTTQTNANNNGEKKEEAK